MIALAILFFIALMIIWMIEGAEKGRQEGGKYKKDMNFEWRCRKCGKRYPASGEGLVYPKFYSILLSNRVETLKCTCGGEIDLSELKKENKK